MYFLQPEWKKNRSDLEGFNSDTFSNATRRVTMSTAFIFDQKTNEKIGELFSSWSYISSKILPFYNSINNDSINIFNKLILPNISTGFIEKSGDSYINSLYFFPPRTITQDIFGHKVVILSEVKDDDRLKGKYSFKIEVYKEDF